MWIQQVVSVCSKLRVKIFKGSPIPPISNALEPPAPQNDDPFLVRVMQWVRLPSAPPIFSRDWTLFDLFEKLPKTFHCPNFCPNVFNLLDRDAFLAALLKAASPCLKAFTLPGDPLFPFNPAIRFFPCDPIHLPIVGSLWQSSIKVEKFDCVFSQLDALRGFKVLVSLLFESGFKQKRAARIGPVGVAG